MMYNAPQTTGLVRPPTKAQMGPSHKTREAAQLIISLSFFIGMALSVFDAGLALKTHGSLVNGLTPLRAGVAGFFFSFMFSTPPSLKEPVFFSSSAASPMRPSITPFTSFDFKPVVSATELYAWVAVMPAFAAFIAFMAFIAFIGAIAVGGGKANSMKLSKIAEL